MFRHAAVRKAGFFKLPPVVYFSLDQPLPNGSIVLAFWYIHRNELFAGRNSTLTKAGDKSIFEDSQIDTVLDNESDGRVTRGKYLPIKIQGLIRGVVFCGDEIIEGEARCV